MTFEEMKQMAEAARSGNGRKRPDNAEHRLQKACVRWYRMQFPHIAHALFAIPNAARRSARTGAYMKEEGLLPGVADLILLKSNRFYGALCIEMKTKTGRQSEAQRQWQRFIETQGCKYVICRSLDEFRQAVNQYLADG